MIRKFFNTGGPPRDCEEGIPLWAVAMPILGLVVMVLGTALPAILVGATLISTVLAAVYHAEVLAHRLGEPFGTLLLAVAVTVIEVSLIISIMLDNPAASSALARDTVFAALMVVLNGIIGLCLLVGGTRHREQVFTQYGVSAGLAMLSTLAVLTLVLPNYTTSEPGPVYSWSQLTFVALVSIIIYGVYVYAQTLRHRDYFLPDKESSVPGVDFDSQEPTVAIPDGPVRAWGGAILMLLALVAVVLLAKSLSPSVQAAVRALDAPQAFVGIVIASLVLLPEGLAAVRAARRDRLQTSLNLALGSALATIGLTIPAVVVASFFLDLELILGLSTKSMVLLALTLLVGTLSLGTGRTTVLQGTVHLIIFMAFLFTVLVP